MKILTKEANLTFLRILEKYENQKDVDLSAFIDKSIIRELEVAGFVENNKIKDFEITKSIFYTEKAVIEEFDLLISDAADYGLKEEVNSLQELKQATLKLFKTLVESDDYEKEYIFKFIDNIYASFIKTWAILGYEDDYILSREELPKVIFELAKQQNMAINTFFGIEE